MTTDVTGCCIGFNVLPFNTFQFISGRYLLETKCMITTLSYSVVSLKYHTAMSWYCAWSHYSGNGSTSFCVELHFIIKSSIRQGSFNYKREIFGLTWLGIEPGTSQTQSECSNTRLPVLLCNVFTILKTSDKYTISMLIGKIILPWLSKMVDLHFLKGCGVLSMHFELYARFGKWLPQGKFLFFTSLKVMGQFQINFDVHYRPPNLF